MRYLIDRISLSTTTICHQGCPHCGQRPLCDRFPGYVMPLASVERLLQRAEELHVHFSRISFSGGEPSEWPHLVDAAKLIRQAVPRTRLICYSNAAHADRLREAAPSIDTIRFSSYRSNAHACRELADELRAAGNRIEIVYPMHRMPPTHAVAGSLPAICGCPAVGYFHDRVWTCAPAPSRLAMTGLDLDDPDYSCSVDDDWADHFMTRRKSRFRQPICRQCISNGKVWRKMKLTEHRP